MQQPSLNEYNIANLRYWVPWGKPVMQRKRKSLSCLSRLDCRVTGAAESNIVEGICGGALAAKSRPVGAAIIGGTEPRTASRDAQPSCLWTNWVVRKLLCSVGIRRIPISYPFPNVPNHVIETKRVSSKRADRRRVEKSISQFIFLRPMTLPDVGTSIFGRIRVAGRRIVVRTSRRMLGFAGRLYLDPIGHCFLIR